MMKKFKRFLALLLVLVLFLGDLGPADFMMLSAYADDESTEIAVTETPAPAVTETPAPAEEPASTDEPAPVVPGETEAPVQTAEPETPEASAAPVTDGETTAESGETPAPSAAPAAAESADTKPARRVSDEIKLDAATTLTIEGVRRRVRFQLPGQLHSDAQGRVRPQTDRGRLLPKPASGI